MHDGALASTEKTARRNVMILALVTGCAASAVLVGYLADGPVGSCFTAACVCGLFLLGELVPVSIEFRRESHTFSFTSVPFAIGLTMLSPPLFVLARLVATAISLGGVRRQPFFRFVTNVASHLLEVVVAAGIVQLLSEHVPSGPAGWLVLGTAVLTADLAGAIFVTTAISVYQRQFEVSLLGGLGLGGITTLADLTVALVVVGLLRAHEAEVWLMAVIAGFIVLLARAYSTANARHHHVEMLYELNKSLGEAVLVGDIVPLLLSQAAEILHAETAWLIIEDTDGRVRRITGTTSSEDSAAEDRIDDAILHLMKADPAARRVEGDSLAGELLRGEGHDEAIAAPMVTGNAQLSVLVVADRSGSVRGFDSEDITLFGTLALHAAVALGNLRLVERLRAESDRNEQLATHDTLTGLPNRAYIQAQLVDVLTTSTPVAVLLIDLDRFKDVNDTLGHQNGDQLLIEAGARMRVAVSDTDVIARLGGDEFALIVRSATSSAELETVAHHLHAELCRPYEIANVTVEIGASIGIALASDNARDAATLLRQADVAMYAAKESRLGVETYTAERDHYSAKRLAMVAQLRDAIDNDELELHYQPLLDLATGQLIGAEALVRWPKPGGGMVMPDDFIYVAEHTGLIHPLTRWVARTAVRQAATWHRTGIPLRISINLSPRNLLEADLAAFLAELLRSEALPPRYLQVEITETTVMSDPERTIEVLRRLRNTGVGIAIDDFGTGHSSLAYLTSLPATELKIDKSFVTAMATDRSARTVVRSIVDLGRNLGLEVLAEGVETPGAAADLHDMGCHLAQGYLFSRPLAPAQFEFWVTSHQPANVTDTTRSPSRRLQGDELRQSPVEWWG